MNGHESHFKVRLRGWTSHDSTDRARHAPVTVTVTLYMHRAQQPVDKRLPKGESKVLIAVTKELNM